MDTSVKIRHFIFKAKSFAPQPPFRSKAIYSTPTISTCQGRLAGVSGLVRGVRTCQGCQDLLGVSGLSGLVRVVRGCQGCQDLSGVSGLVRGCQDLSGLSGLVRTCQGLSGVSRLVRGVRVVRGVRLVRTC